MLASLKAECIVFKMGRGFSKNQLRNLSETAEGSRLRVRLDASSIPLIDFHALNGSSLVRTKIFASDKPKKKSLNTRRVQCDL